MINSFSVQSGHPLYHRFRCAQQADSLHLAMRPGVNVLSAPNGAGKSTLLRILEQALLGKSGAEHVIIDGHHSRKVFFFSLKELDPKQQIDYTSPADPFHHEKIARSLMLLSQSHGQVTRSIMDDLEIIATSERNCLFIVDEPELGLDMNHLADFCKFLSSSRTQALGHQFLIASHHPFLLFRDDWHQIEIDTTADYRGRSAIKLSKLLHKVKA